MLQQLLNQCYFFIKHYYKTVVFKIVGKIPSCYIRYLAVTSEKTHNGAVCIRKKLSEL